MAFTDFFRATKAVAKTSGSKGFLVGAAILAAAHFIGPWEGLRTSPYFDIVGVKTVCYGETRKDLVNRKYTKEECVELLSVRMQEYGNRIAKCLPGHEKLAPETKIAFVSMAYNVGTAGFCRSSTATYANRFIKTGEIHDIRRACDKMLLWNRAGGRVVKGLVNRRHAERKLCLKGANG